MRRQLSKGRPTEKVVAGRTIVIAVRRLAEWGYVEEGRVGTLREGGPRPRAHTATLTDKGRAVDPDEMPMGFLR
jgi:hypothetical protein